MSASGAISNLQQALNCAGKCDCCNKLQQQINEINSKLANIKTVDEQAIINKSVNASKAIVPDITKAVVATSLIPVFDDISGIRNIASGALTLAKEALFLIGKLIAEVAAIAATVAAALGAAAGLQAIYGRIDAVESGLDQANNFIGRLLGQITQVKGIATTADNKAVIAQNGVNNLIKNINNLSAENSLTRSLARTALEQSNEGIRKADLAKTFADRAAEIANIGIQRADKANNRLDNVEPFLDLVSDRVLELRTDVNGLTNNQLRLRYDVDQLTGSVKNLEFKIPGIEAKATQALQESSGAKALSEIANGTARTALQQADSAEDIAQIAEIKAQAAILENAKLRTKINQLEQKDVYLEQGITKAQQEAYAALQLGGLGLVTAQNTAQGLSNVIGQVGSIGNTANNADIKASDALNKISTIKNGVVTTPQIENAIAQPIGKVNAEQQKQAEKIRQIEQKISNPGGINTTPVTRSEFEQIKQKLGEADNMNREGNAKLDEILAKLPALPAAVASATAARVPSVPQIKQAVGEVTCESARSGCIAGALQNQSAGLQDNFKQGLRDLEQGLNAGANAVQTALLTRIDTKLGGQIVGGIGGSLGKFYDWAHIDRALNVLTFAATVHNGMMLSRDIASTLTQALANALSVIGIKDKEGNALNISAIVGSTVENAIKGVIGAENYAQLSTQFALANRIYQSTANVLNNFQNVSSTILNGLEVVGSNNAKVGNALKIAGVVQENAYNWMNPQPKFNTITNRLQALQGGASTILQVTQVPLDIISAVTELNQSTTELVNAIQNDDNDNNKGVGSPEPVKLTEDNTLAKSLSAGLNLEEFDLDADE